jgi:hypothetical protein
MSTVLDIVKGAMKNIGVLASGETPCSEDSNDIFNSLNDMIDSWSTENLTVYGIKIESFPLVAGKQEYTIGSGGDFDTGVPIETDYLYFRNSQGQDFPIQLRSDRFWGDVAIKSTGSTIPRFAYVDNNYPLKTVYLYPVPNGGTIIFHNKRQINVFTSLSETVSLPKGYNRALTTNLAIEIAPQFGATVSPELASLATKSLANIKRANIREVTLKSDPSIISNRGSFNYRTGE